MIKMLTIIITPTTLTFKNLSDELEQAIAEKLILTTDSKGNKCYKGNAEELYRALLVLSYTYDIEIV